MREDEFVDLHGVKAWEKIIKPLQEKKDKPILQAYANAIAHERIGQVLYLLGFKVNSILLAKQSIWRKEIVEIETSEPEVVAFLKKQKSGIIHLCIGVRNKSLFGIDYIKKKMEIIANSESAKLQEQGYRRMPVRMPNVMRQGVYAPSQGMVSGFYTAWEKAEE